jgi:hypothetical protein
MARSKPSGVHSAVEAEVVLVAHRRKGKGGKKSPKDDRIIHGRSFGERGHA